MVGGLFTGDKVKVPSLQMMAAWPGKEGRGLMVTTMVKLVPEHVPMDGVTVYVAVWTVLVVLTSVPLIEDNPAPPAPPVNPLPDGADQL